MNNYSYQLYSSRNFQPWSETFSMLKEAGYRQVEGFGTLIDDLGKVAPALDESGLSMSSTHVSLEALETNPDAIVELLKPLGVQSIYCPYLDEPDSPGESYHLRISFPGTPSQFELEFLDYVEKNGAALSRPLVTLDFSAF